MPLSTLRPEPDDARELLRRELAEQEYQRSPIERFWAWLDERWDELTDQVVDIGAAPTFAIVLLVVGLLVVLGLTLPRVRRDRGAGANAPGGVLDDRGAGADELRRDAEAAAAAGDHERAVATAVRALVRRAVERDLLDDAPGRTTHEVLELVAVRFPDHGDRLRDHADLFDAVVYGRRRVGALQSAAALQLETDVRRTRPLSFAETGRPTGPAVPR
ncbi:DUF4129 domain-containing protein [Nocardioides caldifontis]|uniref:DUF4129 domain-containing protein n=1 Tax=Nocardioides caldifontis TaxID=2588938 RepID=UPI0011DF20AE|nr:DUF4129 domain-containing protein [Nocardioides caldifontis]